MDRRAAVNLAAQLMSRHGLLDEGWFFKLNTNKRRLGVCKRTDKQIEMSVHHVDHATDADIVNTILHEIAHALTPGHMHDDVWRRKALEIGCNGERCGESMKVEFRFVGTCSGCKRTIFRHRRVKGLYHINCGKLAGLYTWKDLSLVQADERNMWLELQKVGR